ncbi:MAG: hypothetical protein VXX52_00420 [Candidatus Neomarinimicrobiota bacterium]|nr:hypothetical protein [Candidatus Neomarinimicrobiota bacterium]MEC8705548.1 hypothetical protein [Candidatus Neomarinimicrobiota bacterium]|tara:strand:+ start:959 stop:1861 length:903 start_codon:yes stop_codon:yes gene_type:complete
MNKFFYLILIFISVLFSQEIDSLGAMNGDSLTIQTLDPDSIANDTIKNIPSTGNVSVADSVDTLEKSDTTKIVAPLPPIRDPQKRVVERLDTGESFFEIKSSIDVLREQVDSLKKIISVYEEGRGAIPNIDEDLLNLIKIPQLRHRIELQNGTVVNGEIIEEDDLGIIVQTSIGQLAIEKDRIIDINEDLPPLAKVELLSEPLVDVYIDREEIRGTVKNIGSKRADFVRVIANLWSPTTQLIYQDSVFISAQSAKFFTGIKSGTSLEPGSTSEFKIVISTSETIDEVSYRTFEVRWESFK